MKRFAFLFIAIFALAVAGSAQGIAVDAAMDNFSLPDVDGKVHTLESLKGKNGAVVIFLSAQCPVVKAYNGRINEIANAYAAKGINFIGINSNATEDLARVKSDAATVGYKFPLLLDKGNVLADKLAANTTPEVYYLDAKNVLVYHGAIDNDRAGTAITDPYLKTAFDMTLAGKKIEKTKTNAVGCSIKRAKAE